MKSKRIILVFFILILSLWPSPPFRARAHSADWEIVGNAVIVDDDRVYLSAEPHTISSSGWVEFNLISKKFGGNIDVVFGFDISEVTPKNPQIWTEKGVREYGWVQANRTDEIIVNNITGYLNLGNDYNGNLDIGNKWNTRFFLVNGTIENETRPWIIGFKEWDITEYPDFVSIKYLYTNWEKEYYFVDGFADWNPDYKVINRDFKGMNKWFVLRSINIAQSKNYKMRIWIEIPFSGMGKVQGKYAWGIKLSSDTIGEAIENNRFYFMDPWISSSWLYRIKLKVDHNDIDADLSFFPVMVYLNSSRINWTHVQDDLDDIRFIWGEEITIILDYELENYTINNEAWFWVEIIYVFNSTDTEFYMYYGNNGAANGEDKEGTWDDYYKMVQHMVDETNSTILDSTINNNDGVKKGANEPLEIEGGIIDSAQDFDGLNTYVIVSDSNSLDLSLNITIDVWIYLHELDWGGQGYRAIISKTNYNQGTAGGYALYASKTGKIGFEISDGVGSRFEADWGDFMTANTWTHLVLSFAAPNARFYVDSVYKGNRVMAIVPGINNWDILIGADDSVGAGKDRRINATLDELRLSNIARSGAWIKAIYESERDDILDYGPEQIDLVISPPDLLFGAGFNATSPYVELHWNHSLVDSQLFEVQNSSDGIGFTYLGESATTNYTDWEVVNGTNRYYRVRARNQTWDSWFYSSWSDVNFEIVYFIPRARTIVQNVTGEWFYYNLTTIAVTVGTHDSGDLNSTLDIDGDTYDCSEVVGAPGYVIEFEWTDVDQDAHCLWVTAYIFYDGVSAHTINVDLWNFTSTAWVTIGIIYDMVDFEWVNSSIYDLRMPNDFINSTGAVRGRFYHASAGNINDDIHTEFLKLYAFIPWDIVTPTISEESFFWIPIAIVLSIIAGLMVWLKDEHNNN